MEAAVPPARALPVLSFERLHLLLELRLLSGRQHAEDLFVEGFRSGRIARAPGGMSRGELIEEVLNLLLLLGREIDAGEPLRPTVIFVGRLVRLPLALGCAGPALASLERTRRPAWSKPRATRLCWRSSWPYHTGRALADA